MLSKFFIVPINYYLPSALPPWCTQVENKQKIYVKPLSADFGQKAKQNSNLWAKENTGGALPLWVPQVPPGGSLQTAEQRRGNPDGGPQCHWSEEIQVRFPGGHSNQNWRGRVPGMRETHKALEIRRQASSNPSLNTDLWVYGMKNHKAGKRKTRKKLSNSSSSHRAEKCSRYH